MTTRERRRDETHNDMPAQSERHQMPEPETETAGSAGDAFLSAADSAIERALSGRPEAFLSQNRQLGGQ